MKRTEVNRQYLDPRGSQLVAQSPVERVHVRFAENAAGNTGLVRRDNRRKTERSDPFQPSHGIFHEFEILRTMNESLVSVQCSVAIQKHGTSWHGFSFWRCQAARD